MSEQPVNDTAALHSSHFLVTIWWHSGAKGHAGAQPSVRAHTQLRAHCHFSLYSPQTLWFTLWKSSIIYFNRRRPVQGKWYTTSTEQPEKPANNVPQALGWILWHMLPIWFLTRSTPSICQKVNRICWLESRLPILLFWVFWMRLRPSFLLHYCSSRKTKCSSGQCFKLSATLSHFSVRLWENLTVPAEFTMRANQT